MPNIDTCWVGQDAEVVAEHACDWLLAKARQAIAERGRFVLILAGGSTPKKLYERLSCRDEDWGNWYLLHGDERCLPAGDAERNATMVEQAWLQRVQFPSQNHLAIQAELGAEIAAAHYGEDIQRYLPADVCLLGMGEDGHTASLFPDHAVQQGDVIAVHDSPKPPSARVSLNYPLLNASRSVCFLVTGAGKQQALRQWAEGITLPVSRIHGGETLLMLDKTAAAYTEA